MKLLVGLLIVTGAFANTQDNIEQKALGIIKANCTNCHFGYHLGFDDLQSADDFIDEGLIEAGNAKNSFLMERIINAGNWNSNMPLGGEALSEEDFATLVEWIDNL